MRWLVIKPEGEVGVFSVGRARRKRKKREIKIWWRLRFVSNATHNWQPIFSLVIAFSIRSRLLTDNIHWEHNTFQDFFLFISFNLNILFISEMGPYLCVHYAAGIKAIVSGVFRFFPYHSLSISSHSIKFHMFLAQEVCDCYANGVFYCMWHCCYKFHGVMFVLRAYVLLFLYPFLL